jgi:hypothetical protein
VISVDGLCTEGDSVKKYSHPLFLEKIPPTPLLEKGGASTRNIKKSPLPRGWLKAGGFKKRGASITKYFFKSLPFWKGPVLLSDYPKGEGFRNVKKNPPNPPFRKRGSFNKEYKNVPLNKGDIQI